MFSFFKVPASYFVLLWLGSVVNLNGDYSSVLSIPCFICLRAHKLFDNRKLHERVPAVLAGVMKSTSIAMPDELFGTFVFFSIFSSAFYSPDVAGLVPFIK